MPLYVIFSLCAAVCIAVSLIINKAVVKGVALTSFQYSSLFHFGGFLGGLLLVTNPLSFEVLLSILPLALLAGILWIIGDIFVFQTLKALDASVVGSIFMFKLLIAPLGAYIIFGEVFSPFVYIWLVPLLFGGIMVSYTKELSFKGFFRKETALLMVAVALFVMVDLIGKKAIDQVGALSYMGVLSLTTSACSLIGYLLSTKGKLPSVSHVKLFTFLGSIVILVNLFISLGLSYNVTITSALSMLNAPFVLIGVLIVSRFKPHMLEDHPKFVYAIRILGMIVMYAASLQIVLAS